MGLFDDEQPGQWKMLPLVMHSCGEPAVVAADFPLLTSILAMESPESAEVNNRVLWSIPVILR